MTIDLSKEQLPKAYRTRGGWKAVVLKDNGNPSCRFSVWHERGTSLDCDLIEYHRLNGDWDADTESDFDLVSEWVEPLTKTVELVFLSNGSVVFDGSAEYVRMCCDFTGYQLTKEIIARKTVTITEGEGMEGVG